MFSEKIRKSCDCSKESDPNWRLFYSWINFDRTICGGGLINDLYVISFATCIRIGVSE